MSRVLPTAIGTYVPPVRLARDCPAATSCAITRQAVVARAERARAQAPGSEAEAFGDAAPHPAARVATVRGPSGQAVAVQAAPVIGGAGDYDSRFEQLQAQLTTQQARLAQVERKLDAQALGGPLPMDVVSFQVGPSGEIVGLRDQSGKLFAFSTAPPAGSLRASPGGQAVIVTRAGSPGQPATRVAVPLEAAPIEVVRAQNQPVPGVGRVSPQAILPGVVGPPPPPGPPAPIAAAPAPAPTRGQGDILAEIRARGPVEGKRTGPARPAAPAQAPVLEPTGPFAGAADILRRRAAISPRSPPSRQTRSPDNPDWNV